MEPNAVPIDYQTVLADLRRKRDELDKAIAGIEIILGLTPSGGAALGAAAANGEPAEVRPDSFFGMSIANAAQKYLLMVKKPQTTPEIASALHRGGLHNQSENFGN